MKMKLFKRKNKYAFLENILSKEDLQIIANTVGEAERTTSGEIVVSIKPHSKWFRFKKDPVYYHAVRVFYSKKLHKTKDRTGILIFLSIEERRLQILADRGINEKVHPELWQNYATTLVDDIKRGRACYGISNIVREVGNVLTQYFPIKPGDINELPNEVVI